MTAAGRALSGADRAGRRIVRLAEVDSTQEVAFALAAAGAPDGTAIAADYQRAGRGRRGRPWVSPAGTALLVSLVVRPRLSPVGWPLYSFAAAVAVADALEALAVRDPRLRWPNDVLVRGRKIAGVLVEARPPASVIVVGVGLNLRQREFPAGLRVPATSVVLETGREVEQDLALATFLPAFDGWRARLEADGFAPVRARWLEGTVTLGARVRVDGVEGVAADLALDGALVVDDGFAAHRVVAGELVVIDGGTGGRHAAGRDSPPS